MNIDNVTLYFRTYETQTLLLNDVFVSDTHRYS